VVVVVDLAVVENATTIIVVLMAKAPDADADAKDNFEILLILTTLTPFSY